MKIIKRVFPVFFILIMVLTACRKEEPSGSAESAEPVTVTEAPAEPGPLTVWHEVAPEAEEAPQPSPSEKPAVTQEETEFPELPEKARPAVKPEQVIKPKPEPETPVETPITMAPEPKPVDEPVVISEPEPPAETIVEPEPEPEPVIQPENTEEPVTIVEPEPIIENYAPESFKPEIVVSAAPEELDWTAPIIVSKPVINIKTPETTSFYQSKVLVSGSLSNFSGTAELSWELSGTKQQGFLTLKENEDFSFLVNTAGYNNTLALSLKASSEQKYISEKVLFLVNDDIGPSITPENRSDYILLSDELSIKGKITNSVSNDKSDEVKQAEMELIGYGGSLPLNLSSDGSFIIDGSNSVFENFPEDVTQATLKITAEDFNYNKTTDFFSIVRKYPDGKIRLSGPLNGDSFTNEIDVLGTTDVITEISWDIPGTGLFGRVKTENSEFSFPIKISGINSNCMLRLYAGEGKGTSFVTRNLYNSYSSPELNLISPVSGDFYGNSVKLEGNIKSSNENDLSFENIKSLFWRYPGATGNKNLIFFDDKGYFSFDINTDKFNGLLPLELAAEDFNGNTARKFLLLQDGKRPPEILLTTPLENSLFGAYIYINGSIIDPYTGTEYGGIESLEYSINSVEDFNLAPIEGLLNVDNNYRFNMEVPSSEMKGKYQLFLNAKANNKNTSDLIINIEKGSSDITDFHLDYKNHTLYADWRKVPGAKSYTLLLSSNETEPEGPSADVFYNVTPPLSLGGITTGTLYKAKVKADTEYGTLWSSTTSYLPVEKNTFMLTATGDFRQINLSWNTLPAVNGYTIYRAENDNKNFHLIADNVSENSYIDKEVAFGIDYSYQIAPKDYDYARSTSATATILKAPEERIKKLNLLSDFKPLDIDVTGNYAYVAAGTDGFRIVDLTVPESLSVTGMLDSPESLAVFVRGDYAYLACRNSGLVVINIMDPVNPFVAGSKSTIDARDIYLKDQYAYIADGASGIKIINIADERYPERAATIDNITADCIFISENTLISGGTQGAYLYDLSSMTSPGPLSFIPSEKIVDVFISDNNAYLLSETKGCLIYDITDKKSPKPVSSLALKDPRDIEINGSYAYIADGRGGLKIIDVSAPAKPKIFDSYRVDKAVSVDNYKDNIIVAESNGLSAVRTFLKGVSFVVNFLNMEDKLKHISLFRNIAFLPVKSSGLHIFSIENPSEPRELKIADSPEFAELSVVNNDLLYLTTSSDKISVFDINQVLNDSSFGHPVAKYEIPFDIRSFSVTDDILSVSVENSGIYFYRDNALAGKIDLPDPRSCITNNRTAYVCDFREGFNIYDIKDFSSVGMYSNIPVEGANFMDIDDDLLIVNGRKGVYIFDVSNEQKPVQAGFIKTYYAEKAVIKKKYIYIAEGYKGLTIYDISDPHNPRLVSTCDTIYAVDIAVAEGYAFITDVNGLNTVKIFIPEWTK